MGIVDTCIYIGSKLQAIQTDGDSMLQPHPTRFSKIILFPQKASTSLAALSFFLNTSPANPPGTVRRVCFLFRCFSCRCVRVEVDSARSEPVVAGHGRICGAATTRKDRTAVVVKRLAVENDFGCIAGGIVEVLWRNMYRELMFCKNRDLLPRIYRGLGRWRWGSGRLIRTKEFCRRGP